MKLSIKGILLKDLLVHVLVNDIQASLLIFLYISKTVL